MFPICGLYNVEFRCQYLNKLYWLHTLCQTIHYCECLYNQILRLFKSKKGWFLHTFYWKFEDHKQVGNLISVFQKYFLFGFAQVVLGRAPFFLNS